MERDKIALVLSAAIAVGVYRTYKIKKEVKLLEMKVDDVQRRLNIAIQIEVDRRFRTIVDHYED